MHVMSLEEWKERTFISRIHVRSEKMRAIDAALKRFHQTKSLADIAAVRQAIEAWKAAHGDEWANSKRNRDNVIDDLYRQTMDPHGMTMSADERAAFDYMLEESYRAHVRLFDGAQFKTKPLAALAFANSFRSSCATAKKGFDTANKIRQGAQGVHSTARGAGQVGSGLSKLAPVVNVVGPNLSAAKEGLVAIAQPGMELVKASSHVIQQAMRVAYDLINQLIPIEVVSEVVRDLLQPLIEQFAATLAPYIGMAKSGASAVINWGKAARDIYRLSWTEKHSIALAEGAPIAAFEAMQKIIERELYRHSTDASIATIDAVVRAALTAADYGAGSQAIVGGVTALANMTHSIFLAGRDYYEKYQAHQTLKTPEKIDLKIFNTHPVLGCYFITSADTSSLLQLVQRDFGQIGWQGSVSSEIRRHLDPLQTLATEYIDACRFELVGKDGLPFRGAFYKGGLGKLKQTAVRKAKNGAVGLFVEQNKLSEKQLVGMGPKGPRRIKL